MIGHVLTNSREKEKASYKIDAATDRPFRSIASQLAGESLAL